jgi:hypothetical protein
MRYEARVTVHQKGTQKPDYGEIHRRMEAAGYSRVLSVGGHQMHELHGMYTKTTYSITTIDTERTEIEKQLQSMGFGFSIELFQISDTRTFNLEPAPDYGALFGLSGKR